MSSPMDRQPVCADCGHGHASSTGCADHTWDDCCPYQGLTCPSELDRITYRRDVLESWATELLAEVDRLKAERDQLKADMTKAIAHELARIADDLDDQVRDIRSDPDRGLVDKGRAVGLGDALIVIRRRIAEMWPDEPPSVLPAEPGVGAEAGEQHG